jgi:hypothetical protein
MGRVVPEFQQKDLREIICRSYRIIHSCVSKKAAEDSRTPKPGGSFAIQ